MTLYTIAALACQVFFIIPVALAGKPCQTEQAGSATPEGEFCLLKQQQLVKADHYNRSGPVRYVVQELGDGKSAIINLSVAYEDAPVPVGYYKADYYQVVLQDDLDVLLVFGKLDYPNSQQLRNKIEICFPAELFVRQLWNGSREFQKTLEREVEKLHLQAVGASKVSAQTDKVQTFYSNNVLMVLSAGHCMMDFFYISAKDLWLKPPKNEAIGMEALVRVITSGALALGFLQECNTMAEELIEKLGIKLEAENATVEPK